jgi:hypothetical protein
MFFEVPGAVVVVQEPRVDVVREDVRRDEASFDKVEDAVAELEHEVVVAD